MSEREIWEKVAGTTFEDLKTTCDAWEVSYADRGEYLLKVEQFPSVFQWWIGRHVRHTSFELEDDAQIFMDHFFSNTVNPIVNSLTPFITAARPNMRRTTGVLRTALTGVNKLEHDVVVERAMLGGASFMFNFNDEIKDAVYALRVLLVKEVEQTRIKWIVGVCDTIYEQLWKHVSKSYVEGMESDPIPADMVQFIAAMCAWFARERIYDATMADAE